MSDTVQFRIQMPLHLRDRFKSYCLKSNVTMTDKLEQMIEREVSGLSPTQLAATNKIASLNDDRLIARVIDAADRLGSSAASMGNGLQQSFAVLKTELLRAIPKPPTMQKIAEDERAAAEADEKRLSQMLGKTEALNERIVAAVEQSHQRMLAAIKAKQRLRQAIGAGAALGAMTLGFVLWAISGSSPARSIAVRLTSQHDAWHAALWIAGDRQPKRIALLSETAGLLQTAEFRESYGKCVDRAKRTKRNLNCTVTFTILDEVE
jgi:hypothetical protein